MRNEINVNEIIHTVLFYRLRFFINQFNITFLNRPNPSVGLSEPTSVFDRGGEDGDKQFWLGDDGDRLRD